MGELFGIGASLVGGFIGKRLGVRAKGRKQWQKIAAPVAAVAAAMGANAVTGDPETGRVLLESSGVDAAAAVAVHSVLKNAWQFIRD